MYLVRIPWYRYLHKTSQVKAEGEEGDSAALTATTATVTTTADAAAMARRHHTWADAANEVPQAETQHTLQEAVREGVAPPGRRPGPPMFLLGSR